MIRIDRPDMDVTMVYTDVVGEISNVFLRTRFNACLPHIQSAADEFEQKITTGQIYTIPTEENVNADLSVHAFMELYSQQFVAKVIGRAYYDRLLGAAPEGLCPLCGYREASTLDHYLPKSLFPRLSVVPINLVPACKDCNTGKKIIYPLNSEQETLHPYFDDLDYDLWLTMEVVHQSPVSIVFLVQRAEGWDDLTLDRVVSHFDSYSLQELYGVQAARELSGMKRKLNALFDSGGAEEVRKFLISSADSWADVRLNSWRTAFYHGLAVDDWFCETGHSLIAGRS